MISPPLLFRENGGRERRSRLFWLLTWGSGSETTMEWGQIFDCTVAADASNSKISAAGLGRGFYGMIVADYSMDHQVPAKQKKKRKKRRQFAAGAAPPSLSTWSHRRVPLLMEPPSPVQFRGTHHTLQFLRKREKKGKRQKKKKRKRKEEKKKERSHHTHAVSAVLAAVAAYRTAVEGDVKDGNASTSAGVVMFKPCSSRHRQILRCVNGSFSDIAPNFLRTVCTRSKRPQGTVGFQRRERRCRRNKRKEGRPDIYIGPSLLPPFSVRSTYSHTLGSLRSELLFTLRPQTWPLLPFIILSLSATPPPYLAPFATIVIA